MLNLGKSGKFLNMSYYYSKTSPKSNLVTHKLFCVAKIRYCDKYVFLYILVYLNAFFSKSFLGHSYILFKSISQKPFNIDH